MSSSETVLGIIAFIGCTVVLLFAGAGLESNRIYNKCMKANGDMVHNEAVIKCSEMVK